MVSNLFKKIVLKYIFIINVYNILVSFGALKNKLQLHKNSIIKLYLKLRYFVFFIVLVFGITNKNFAQDKSAPVKPGEREQARTIEPQDTIEMNDTVQVNTDSNDDDLIEHEIIYSAVDSIVLSRDAKKVYLYNDAKIQYGDVTLNAYFIEYDQENNFVYAHGYTDSLGQLQGKPEFKEKGDEFIAKTIKYNFKTKKVISKMFLQKKNKDIYIVNKQKN